VAHLYLIFFGFIKPFMYILFQFVCVVFLIYILLFTLSCIRFCVCILHEIFTRWLSTLHKLILAHHDEDCGCDCSFCLSCGDFDTLSIGKFMRMMLCPPSLRFHGSSTTLNGRAEDIYIYIYIFVNFSKSDFVFAFEFQYPFNNKY